MHIQVIRNDHAPYAAMVKIRDTMDADPRETWYISDTQDGYYAHTSDGGFIDIYTETVSAAILEVVENAVAELFEEGEAPE
jgi:hypothetical protein